MSEPPAGASVHAAWSLQGKAPGQVAYDVQAGSVEPRIAQKYFWAASTETPRADRAHAPEALPWVAFLGGTEAGRPVTGLVETTWSGGRDATGRNSYSARLLLVDWHPTSDAGLTWSSLYDAALDTEWPTTDPGAVHPPHIVLDAAPTTVAKLARYIEHDIGFEWAARSAALLLEGRNVAITLSPEHAGLNAVTRVAVLDGICALLPYGSRAWLTGATWAGHGADHELRLTFALRPRGSQCHAVLAGQPPQEPCTSQGRAYVAELLRLRQKKGIEALLSHLLSHRAPLTPHDAEQALQHLRDLDLQAMVVGDIDQGTSELRNVARLLSRSPLESLIEPEAAKIARHLACRTLPGARSEAERELARSLLLEHWSPRVGAALADELNSWPAESQTPQRVRGILDLAAAAESWDRQAHTVVLTGYLDGGGAREAPNGLRSRGTLLQAIQQDLDANSAAAVHAVLVRRPELALAWLDVNAERGTLDDRLVLRLLRRPASVTEPNAPHWLRGVALIHRELSAAPRDEESIEAFAAVSATAWRTGLYLACHARNPDVLDWLEPELYDVAAGQSGTDEDRGFLIRRIDMLVPRQPGLAGKHAAWADLIQLPLLEWDLPRSRLLADDGKAAAEYAGVLRRLLRRLGLPGRGQETVAAALVGNRLDQVPYPVLWQLTHPQDDPVAGGLESLEGPLLSRIAELLTHAGDWITHGMPAPWEHRLRGRPDLQWLAYTSEIRRLVATRTAAPEQLGDAIVRASPHSRYARRAQTIEYPFAVLEAIKPWLQDHAGRGDAVHRLARHLNRRSGQQALGDLLYYSISQLRFGDLVRHRALEGHEELKDSVERGIKLMRQKPKSSAGLPYDAPRGPVPGTDTDPDRGSKSWLPWRKG
ncbi:hypothetical protein [Streptomyces sp. NPDC050388]|uniref:hypothetical protein n=1 Tax=Streptomyces sp. NPDC050388 TaxID=3155781 RepID=UPI003420C2C4